MVIVLLGKIPKGDEVRKKWIDWKGQYIQILKRRLPEVNFVHGDAISEIYGAELVVGHDLSQIKKADICVVDAQTRVGAGTAQEIVFAKYLKKPVVIVMPKDSHHRKSGLRFDDAIMKEWIHPFLKISTDYVAESIEDAADWIEKYWESPNSFKIKDISVFDDAINTFNKTPGISN